MTTLFARTDRSILGRWWWTVDKGLLALVLALIVIGVMLIAAASPPVALRIGLDEFHFLRRHLILLPPALTIMIGVSFLEPRTVRRLGVIVLAGSILALIAVLFTGSEVKGAQRWLRLPGFSLQPGEFVKPAFAVTAAWLMALQKENPAFPGHKITAGLFAVIAALLLLQPDLGMTIVLAGIYGAQIVMAGFPLLFVGALILLALGGLTLSYFIFGHVRSRIDRFLNPEAGDTFQVDRALEALQNGGVTGVGLGQGDIKLHLPDAHADFVFAVAGEEMGLMITTLLVLLFALTVLRGFARLSSCGDLFVLLAAGGLLVMVGGQALIHMGANTHLLPAKGMTLPFISYGGSSLLALSYAMGSVLALTRHTKGRS